jgi:hypothetical protein
MVEAIQKERFKDALTASDQYHGLESQGIVVPPDLLWLEAQAADKAGDPLRAYDALTAYLKAADPANRSYNRALEWYPHVAEAAKPKQDSKRRQHEYEERQAELAEAVRTEAKASAARVEAGSAQAANEQAQQEEKARLKAKWAGVDCKDWQKQCFRRSKRNGLDCDATECIVSTGPLFR